jgi:hypothetical protein
MGADPAKADLWMLQERPFVAIQSPIFLSQERPVRILI